MKRLARFTQGEGPMARNTIDYYAVNGVIIEHEWSMGGESRKEVEYVPAHIKGYELQEVEDVSDKTELLPCPCCRGTNIVLVINAEPWCIDCNLGGASIEAWNTRHLPPEVEKVIEAARTVRETAHTESCTCKLCSAFRALDSEGRK